MLASVWSYTEGKFTLLSTPFFILAEAISCCWQSCRALELFVLSVGCISERCWHHWTRAAPTSQEMLPIKTNRRWRNVEPPIDTRTKWSRQEAWIRQTGGMYVCVCARTCVGVTIWISFCLPHYYLDCNTKNIYFFLNFPPHSLVWWNWFKNAILTLSLFRLISDGWRLGHSRWLTVWLIRRR